MLLFVHLTNETARLMMAAMMNGPVTADLSLMRELNQALILNLVRQEGHISRAEIAKRTHLSRSTVSNIINDLIEANRIYEFQKGESRGGRRPILIGLNYRSHCAIGIEIATSYLDLVITDLQAAILHHYRESFAIEAGPDVAVAQVKRLVDRALADTAINRECVAGVGIGVPGPLTHASAKTIEPPIMPGWSGTILADRFGAALPFKVIVDNDANLGALAEYHSGAAQGIRNMAYIYLGQTGIGAGLVINGSIYRGDIGSAGEIGHITIDEDGPQCRCGSYGCLEAMAGLPQILSQASALGQGFQPDLDQLIERAHNGDNAIRDLFLNAGRHLGVAIASLLNLFNPGLVVVGGPLAAAGNLLIESARLTARGRALPITLQHCDIVAGSLGSHAVALGAASQIIQGVFSPASLGTLVDQL
jgi:predicted NBD/HSP70 family sugar kinase/DNA-binding MarR family transcriptional regulator